MDAKRKIRMTVIQPDSKCDLDRMGRWLQDDGVDVHVVRPFAGDAVPRSIQDDALIVLGGAMGALDEGTYPYLAEIKTLLQATVAMDTPVLGVCLGAQMLADALGGEVAVGSSGLESGLVDVSLLEAASDDPLMRHMPAEFQMPALHFDAVTRLPEGAVLLGTGERYPNQIFRIGPAWGVQFHAEISPARFVEWRGEVPESSLVEVDEQARDFAAADASVSVNAQNLACGFADVVRQRLSRHEAA